MISNYISLHNHTDGSNISSPDVPITASQLVLRAKELGMNAIALTDHGNNVKKYDFALACKKHDIKPIFGIEGYFVYDADTSILSDKGDSILDSTNAHIILLAKNYNGFKQINLLMSHSYENNFYKKPRMDMKSIRKYISPNDVFITTACIGGIFEKYNPHDVVSWFSDFISTNSFYVEIQAHHSSAQIVYNKKILGVAKQYNLPLVYGNDTHAISEKDAELRTAFLKTKGIVYEEEAGNNWFVDFPSYKEVIYRLTTQKALSSEEVAEAISNTIHIANACEYYSIADYKLRVPILKSLEGFDYNTRHAKLVDICNSSLETYFKNNPKITNRTQYHTGLDFELNEIYKCQMADYFLFNYEMIQLAVTKYGGVLTKTSRGSASTYITNFLLGFTAMDKYIFDKLPLFSERFMIAERILQSKTVPDRI